MLHDYRVHLQLCHDRAADLAREYQRAQKLESQSLEAARVRPAGLALRLRRRKARQASAQA